MSFSPSKNSKAQSLTAVHAVATLEFDAFIARAGSRHAPLVQSLWKDERLLAIVLFIDSTGQRKALLPVGPNRSCTSVEDAMAASQGDLRPRYLLLRRQQPRPEVDVVQKLPQAIAVRDARERELERLERQLAEREAYVVQCEARLTELMQELSERESALDQRADELEAFARRLRVDQDSRNRDALATGPGPRS